MYPMPAIWCGCTLRPRRIKGYPFEVVLAGNPPSAVLADQVRSLDWRARKARRKGSITSTELAEVRAKIKVLIG